MIDEEPFLRCHKNPAILTFLNGFEMILFSSAKALGLNV
jgi:hypothetical protein